MREVDKLRRGSLIQLMTNIKAQISILILSRKDFSKSNLTDYTKASKYYGITSWRVIVSITPPETLTQGELSLNAAILEFETPLAASMPTQTVMKEMVRKIQFATGVTPGTQVAICAIQHLN